MPKRHKYALDVQTKIGFAILLALPQQKTLRNGDYYEISETAEKIYIGKDFPDEFAHGKDKTVLKGPNLKAKANAAQAVEELIQIAENKSASEDFKEKHGEKAKYGWYRYDTRLALPVYNDEGVENFEGVPEFWEVKKIEFVQI